MSMIKKIIDFFSRRRNPIDYWRKKGATIGDECEIYYDAYLGSEPYLIEIGNHVRINSGVNIVTHDGGIWVLRYLYDSLKDADIFKKVTIGNNVHIGTNALIMPGVSIGNNVIIGSGAIVTKNVGDNTIVAGVPAKRIESIEEYFEKHIKDVVQTKKMTNKEKKCFLQLNFSSED